jgi:hypothetical protein
MPLIVTWKSDGRRAEHPANPDFPNGMRLDVSSGREPSCEADFTYPAPACGTWVVNCHTCGFSGIATAAGRSDDPRSIRVACRKKDRR